MRYHVKIDITLKPTVMDAQGTTIERALHTLGHAAVSRVRIGKFVTLETEAADAAEAQRAAEAMCRELLANPIIEQYHVVVAESEAA